MHTSGCRGIELAVCPHLLSNVFTRHCVMRVATLQKRDASKLQRETERLAVTRHTSYSLSSSACDENHKLLFLKVLRTRDM